jgi:hypothetical protein
LYQTEAEANQALMPDNLKINKARNTKVQASAYHAGQAFGASINLNLQVGKEAQKLSN